MAAPVTESPIKNPGIATTRTARTKQLRDRNFIVFLTLAEFEASFFDGSLSTRKIQSCKLTKDEYDTAVKKFPKAKANRAVEKDAYGPVCTLLNKISTKYCQKQKIPDDEQIGFCMHAFHPPCHHPDVYTNEAATQKPDIVAIKKLLIHILNLDIVAWRLKEGGSVNKPAVAWHHLASALEGKGPKDSDAVYQAATYAGSVLQARPDLVGNFSIAFDVSSFRLLYSDPCGVYATPEIAWTSPDASRLLLIYIHHLHHPWHVDPTFILRPASTEFDLAPYTEWTKKSYAQKPRWIVRDDKGNSYLIDEILSVGEPWTRKSLVGISTHYGAGDNPEEQPERTPVIVKDSFLHPDRIDASSEGDLLDRIHAEGQHVLGVMRKIDGFKVLNGNDVISNIDTKKERNGQVITSRHRYRLILDAAYPTSLLRCPSVLVFLMVIFDLLAILRFLHEKHSILHRDVSFWNLVFLGTGEQGRAACDSYYASVTLGSEQPRFSGQFLSDNEIDFLLRNLPACLLLDFDNAKLELDKGYTGVLRTLTPIFLAREIARGESREDSIPPKPIPQLTGKALEAYIRVYGKEHYEQQSALLDGVVVVENLEPPKPVHMPRHDAESALYVVWFFLIMALPKEDKPTPDDHVDALSTVIKGLESLSRDEADNRETLMVHTISQWRSALHPKLASLAPFLRNLGTIFAPEYALVHPTPNPYHAHEAMQRYILQEIWRLKESGDPISLDTTQQRKYKRSPDHSATAPGLSKKRASDSRGDPEDEPPKKKAKKQSIRSAPPDLETEDNQQPTPISPTPLQPRRSTRRRIAGSSSASSSRI